MKRLPIGIGLLLVLLVLGFWLGSLADGISEEIAGELEKAACAESWRAGAAVDVAQERWEAHRELYAAITDHGEIDEIEAGFAQAEAYRRRGDLTQFNAVCARLARLVAAMGEAHRLSWENLL